jgi:hypothetical protein
MGAGVWMFQRQGALANSCLSRILSGGGQLDHVAPAQLEGAGLVLEVQAEGKAAIRLSYPATPAASMAITSSVVRTRANRGKTSSTKT